MIVDAKSGVSGAGKTLRDELARGRRARELLALRGRRPPPRARDRAGCSASPVCFVPHLLPVRRGLLATCYLHTDADARALLEQAYAGSAVVSVLPEGVEPEIGRLQGTDAAEIGVFADRATGTTIVICAIDNLGKGAAGQAIQNANLALGLRRDGRAAARGASGYERHRRQGLRRLGRRRRHPPRATARTSRSSARCRRRSARRCSRATASRPPACEISREHLALAEPQAVVINSGVANAATGERGRLDALATAAEAGTAARPARPRRCSSSRPA